MDLANATNGLYVPYDGWIGQERNIAVKENGAIIVADPLMVYAYYYLGYINTQDPLSTYAIRLSKTVLDVTFYTFYARKGEPWKGQFDMAIT